MRAPGVVSTAAGGRAQHLAGGSGGGGGWGSRHAGAALHDALYTHCTSLRQAAQAASEPSSAAQHWFKLQARPGRVQCTSCRSWRSHLPGCWPPAAFRTRAWAPRRQSATHGRVRGPPAPLRTFPGACSRCEFSSGAFASSPRPDKCVAWALGEAPSGLRDEPSCLHRCQD